MADKGDASITVGADLGPMQQAFSEAQTLVKTRMDGIASSVKSSLAGVAATIAGAFAFKELKDFVGGVAEARAHLQDLAETSGSTVETLSKIQGVAKVTGTSMDDVSTALVKLTKGLATGDEEGGKASNALKALGIDARNANGSLRDAGEIYLEVAQKLGTYEDGAGKTAIALDLFGKAGAAQLPLLKDMAAAGDLVAKTTVEQAEEAKQYEQNLKRLEIQLASNKKILAGEMIPAANDFIVALSGMLKGTDGLTAELKKLQADGSLKEFGRDAALVAAHIIDAFDGVGRIFQIIGKAIGGVAAATIAIISGEFGQARSIISALDSDVDGILNKKLFSDRLKEQFKASDAKKPEAEKPKLDYRGTDPNAKGGRLEDTSKAEFAVAKAQFEAALALQKEYLKEAQEGYDDAYKHNLISIREYYDDRIATEQGAIQKEIDAKNFEIQATQKAQSTAATDRERLGLKAQEIKLTGELTVLTAQYAQVAVRETRAMTEAERQRADGLREIQIASRINIGNSQVAMDRIALNTRKSLRQESDADAIQEEKAFEDRLTAIQRQAIQDRLEMERSGTNDPVKIAALNAQLEDLERQHQVRLTELDAQATIERNKYATQAAEAVQSSFETFFNDLTDRTKKLSDTFKDFGKSLLAAFNSIQSKKLAESLFGGGTSGGGMLNDLMKSLFGGSATPAKAPGGAVASAGVAAGAGGAAAGGADADPMGDFIKNIDTANSGLTNLSSGGIGGMFKSATDWIAKQILGTTAQATQTSVSQTMTTAFAALSEAAYSAAAALSTIQASGASSGGGSMLGGLAGMFGKSAAGAGAASSGAAAAGSSDFAVSAIAGFADGTDFVPRDMIAMIHEGERITPAKFNVREQGNVTIHQTVNVPPSTSRASGSQTAGAVAGATTQALRRNS